MTDATAIPQDHPIWNYPDSHTAWKRLPLVLQIPPNHPLWQKPPDHPIWKAWSAFDGATTEGEAELAKAGDAGAARGMLETFLFQLELDQRDKVRGANFPDGNRRLVENNALTQYLAECFERILDGEDPRIALNLGDGKKRRPKDSAEKHLHLYIIGMMFAEKLKAHGRGGYDKAKAEIAKEMFCSEGTAERAYKTYAKLSR